MQLISSFLWHDYHCSVIFCLVFRGSKYRCHAHLIISSHWLMNGTGSLSCKALFIARAYLRICHRHSPTLLTVNDDILCISIHFSFYVESVANISVMEMMVNHMAMPQLAGIYLTLILVNTIKNTNMRQIKEEQNGDETPTEFQKKSNWHIGL